MSTERDKLVVVLNNDVKMSRGKYAAQAVHAALTELGVHPGCAVIVLGGRTADILEMPTQITDAGLTEIPSGTLTAGADRVGPGQRYVSPTEAKKLADVEE